MPRGNQTLNSPGMKTADLPLPTLLSQVLVAFTIEFDNEFEHQMPHRTTRLGSSGGGPWLASMVMWSNFMQFVSDEGVTVAEVKRLARTAKLPLSRMARWGYVVVEPRQDDPRPKPPLRDWLIRPTAKGRRAQEMWRPLFGVIEKRWQARFGKDEMGALRESLLVLVRQFDVELPQYLPVLGYGMIADIGHQGAQAPASGSDTSNKHLPTLLSRVLLAFAMDFEHESDLSLAISANVLRVLNEIGVRVREIPRLSGVSKEAIKMSLGFLVKRGCVLVEAHPTESRHKQVRLTPKGTKALDMYWELVRATEERWQARFGQTNIQNLRRSLEKLVVEPAAQLSPLFQGMKPYPDGWRASVPEPNTLPHYPMVLHRGGYPDGS